MSADEIQEKLRVAAPCMADAIAAGHQLTLAADGALVRVTIDPPMPLMLDKLPKP
jgi:hypothetical protein